MLSIDKFRKKISDKSINITVVGLGKMGLPIAMVFANQGFNVIGYDISEELIQSLNKGITNMKNEPGVADRLKISVERELFQATNDPNIAFNEADVIITIIPILDTITGEQELTILKKLYKEMARKSRTDTLFVQESTLSPGTSLNELWPILKEISISKENINFGLVFAPERTLSGRAIKDIEENYPKLVGGINENDGRIAKLLYEKIAQKGVILLSDATTAEAVKTFKGAYRDANIAIANQFAIMADIYGVDVLEVIEAANTEPFSHIHRPGIGVGGHCIPVYPKFLIYSSEKSGYSPNILTNSREVNDFMVDYAINKLEEVSENISSVLVLGLAYRNNIKEFRHSPTLRLVPTLRSKNYQVRIADPLYNSDEINKLLGENSGVEYDQIEYNKYDTIIIVTDHSQFEEINTESLEGKLIYDGRYMLDRSKHSNAKILQPGRLSTN